MSRFERRRDPEQRQSLRFGLRRHLPGTSRQKFFVTPPCTRRGQWISRSSSDRGELVVRSHGGVHMRKRQQPKRTGVAKQVRFRFLPLKNEAEAKRAKPRRPRANRRTSVPHSTRPDVRGVCHVVLRVRRGLPWLRTPRTYRVLERAIEPGRRRTSRSSSAASRATSISSSKRPASAASREACRGSRSASRKP